MITVLSLVISAAALLAALVQTRRYALARAVMVFFALGAGNIHLATAALTVMLLVNNGFRPPVVRMRRTEIMVGVLVGLIILISLLSPITIRTLVKLVHLGLFIFILFQLIQELADPERIRLYLRAMVWAGATVAVVGLMLSTAGVTEIPHIFLGRGANEASTQLSLLGLLGAVTLLLWERRPVYLLPSAIIALAQVMAVSRSNTALAGIMFAALVFFYFDSRLIKAAMIAAAGGIAYAMQGLVTLQVEQQVNFSARERIELTRFGWELWLQRPWTGWGWGSASNLVPRATLVELEYPHFHNTWVQLIAEVGAVGWLLIALFCWFSLRCIWIALRWAKSPAVSAYVVLATIGIGWLGFFEALTFGADRVIILLFVLPIMGHMTTIATAASRTAATPPRPEWLEYSLPWRRGGLEVR